jgi:hypothetical protein
MGRLRTDSDLIDLTFLKSDRIESDSNTDGSDMFSLVDQVLPHLVLTMVRSCHSFSKQLIGILELNNATSCVTLIIVTIITTSVYW